MSAGEVTVYLGLGSNMGDRSQNLQKALEYLSQRLKMTETSSVYETPPVAHRRQPLFLNMVLKVYSRLQPNELLLLIKGIERKMGRLPGRANAPRPIDIDILLYDDQVIKDDNLTIPHPRLAERAFVLIPLAEIAPGLVHPARLKTIKQLLGELGSRQGVVKRQPGEEENVPDYGGTTF